MFEGHSIIEVNTKRILSLKKNRVLKKHKSVYKIVYRFQHHKVIHEAAKILLCLWFGLSLILYADYSYSQKKFSSEQIKFFTDSLANSYLSANENSGLTFGIIYENSDPLIYTYGFSDKSKNKKVLQNSIFQIASITKVFTSTLLAIFVNDKLVALSDPVQKYLPSNVKMPEYDGVKITIEQICTHTSGLPRLPPNFWVSKQDKINPYANYTLNKLYEFLNNYKLSSKPGTISEYSNIGYGLLGQVLCNISEDTYEDLVVEKICDILNMPDTRTTLNKEQNARRVQGYSEFAVPVHEWTFQNCTAGLGGLFSTIKDMTKWLKFNMGAVDNSISDVIDITEKVYWQKPDGSNKIGLGWGIYDVKNTAGENLRVYSKDGLAGGCTSYITFTKNPKTGVVVMSNSSNVSGFLGIALLNYLLDLN